MMKWWRSATILAALILLSGCANEFYRTIDTFPRDGKPVRILMMPPDVELYELTAGGNMEVNAQWTKNAERFIADSVRGHLKDIKADFVEYTEPADGSPEWDSLAQMQSLHKAVSEEIKLFHFIEENRLPSKHGKFDWSLGPNVQTLAQHSGARYALFMWARDSYSTPARRLLQVVAVITGIGAPEGGHQVGASSLVDLSTGQVVWFNYLYPREAGDLRNRDDARSTVDFLLGGMPK